MQLQPHRFFRQLWIDRELASGGMSLVYLGVDREQKRFVAVKTILEELWGDEDYRRRFARELKVHKSLSHPHVVRFVDGAAEPGACYLATEFIRGLSLDQLLRSAPGGLPVAEVVRIVECLTAALFHLHSKGVVHRDLQPRNVLLEDTGGIKVFDFGISQAEDQDLRTRSGTVMGTLTYSSPEQNQGKRVDERSDLYSLGLMLFELLTGNRAIQGSSLVEITEYQLSREVPPPDLLRPEVPEALGSLVHRLVRRQPDERPKSARHLLDALIQMKATANPEERKLLVPDEGSALLDLARRILHAGRLDEALARAREAAGRRPDDAGAAVLLARIHTARGELAETRQAYEKALHLLPGERHIPVDYALALHALGEETAALDTLEPVLERDDQNRFAQCLRNYFMAIAGKGLVAQSLPSAAEAAAQRSPDPAPVTAGGLPAIQAMLRVEPARPLPDPLPFGIETPVSRPPTSREAALAAPLPRRRRAGANRPPLPPPPAPFVEGPDPGQAPADGAVGAAGSPDDSAADVVDSFDDLTLTELVARAKEIHAAKDRNPAPGRPSPGSDPEDEDWDEDDPTPVPGVQAGTLGSGSEWDLDLSDAVAAQVPNRAAQARRDSSPPRPPAGPPAAEPLARSGTRAVATPNRGADPAAAAAPTRPGPGSLPPARSGPAANPGAPPNPGRAALASAPPNVSPVPRTPALAPPAPASGAPDDRGSGLLAAWQARTAGLRTKDEDTALSLGLVLPGLGEFYAGLGSPAGRRMLLGLAALGVAAWLLLAGPSTRGAVDGFLGDNFPSEFRTAATSQDLAGRLAAWLDGGLRLAWGALALAALGSFWLLSTQGRRRIERTFALVREPAQVVAPAGDAWFTARGGGLRVGDALDVLRTHGKGAEWLGRARVVEVGSDALLARFEGTPDGPAPRAGDLLIPAGGVEG